ncbi:transposase [Lactiplantibacillus argentoratensis]
MQKNSRLMTYTPKVKVKALALEVFFMTKISKETKLRALTEYFAGQGSSLGIANKYQIAPKLFRMLVAAYRTHGANVLYNPPQVTPDFRIEVAHWSIINNASYTQVAAKFGYVGIPQIKQWKEIYRNQGPNGLMSISKGRKPQMTNKRKKPTKKRSTKKKLSPEENRLKQLEAENLELRIKNEALKLLASMKQRTKNSPK